MYKCLNCGHIFSEGEQGSYKENVGEYWGCECYEAHNCCPVCKGDYEEATKCKFCGGVFLDEELNCGMCEECIEDKKREYTNDPQACFDLCKDFTETITLNGFLSAMFNRSQIEEILLREIKNSGVDCTQFIFLDEECFIELLEKENE